LNLYNPIDILVFTLLILLIVYIVIITVTFYEIRKLFDRDKD